MKFNPKDLKNVDYKKLALNHGEKAAMVVGGIFFIWAVYSFFGAESTEYSPNQLRERVETAAKNIEANQPPEPPKAENFAMLAEARVDPALKIEAVSWSRPFFRPAQGRGQRGKPDFLAAMHPHATADTVTVEVKGAAGVGVIERRIKNEEDDEDEEDEAEPVRSVKPYRFVSVRFLAPLKRQIEEFAKVHLNGIMPEYWDVKLERRQVGSDGAWTAWQAVDFGGFATEFKEWSGMVEVVNERFTSPVLTFPLPNRVIGQWGKHGSHPQLAMLDLPQPVEQTQEQTQAAQEDDANAQQSRGGAAGALGGARPGAGQPIGGGLGNAAPFRRMLLPQQQGAGQDSAYGGGGGGAGNPFSGSQGQQGGQGFQGQGGQGFQGQGGQVQGGGNPFGGNQGQGGGQVQGQGQQQQQAPGGRQDGPPEWLLFRFLDFTVQPGEAYQYRIKLVLKNPNFGVEQDLLQDGNKAIAENELEESKWSEETGIVIVPNDIRYLVAGGNIDHERRNIELDLFIWDEAMGSFAAHRTEDPPRPLKQKFSPGDNISVTGTLGKLVDFTTNTKKDHRVKAVTNDTVISYIGGRELLDLGPDFPSEARELTLPQVLLVLDGQGQWQVNHQKKDEEIWSELGARLRAEQESAQEEEEEEEEKGQGQGQFGQGQFGGQGGQGQGQFGGQGGQGQGQGAPSNRRTRRSRR